MATWFASATRFSDPAGALRIGQFVQVLGRFPAGHLVDLGCGHGIFARVAADLGWRVTAVDARSERFPDDPRVTWVTADIREFDGLDGADLIACLGLWYHLTLDDQRRLAARCAPRPLLIDTHLGMPDLSSHVRHADRLSALLQRDGYAGRLYHETGRVTRPTASWGNEYSFWPTGQTLERQLTEAGYDTVDLLRPGVAPDRGFVLATVQDAPARAVLDEVVSRYDPLADPAAAPLPAGTDPAAAFTQPRAATARPGPAARGLRRLTARIGRPPGGRP